VKTWVNKNKNNKGYRIYLVFAVLAVLVFATGFYTGFNVQEEQDFAVNNMTYYNLSEGKSFAPRFSVCRVDQGNQTDFFYAGNKSVCLEKSFPKIP